MPSRPLKKEVKYTAVYFLIRSLIFISNIVPRRAWLSFCGFLGRVAHRFAGKTRLLAIANLTVAYGHEKSAEEIQTLARNMFIMLAKNGGDILRARAFKTLTQFEKIVKMHGYENYERAIAKGKGVLFVTCHLGAFDLQVSMMSLRGLKPNIIGTPLKDERLNELLFEYRNAHGAIAIPRGKEMFRLIKALKSGGTVAILIDQDTKVKSRFVNFFGKPAATPVGAAILSMKTGAIVVPTYIYLNADGCHHMHLLEEIPLVLTGNDEADMITNTQNYTHFIEEQVRKYPEQWVWMHERWRTKPGEEVR